LTTPSIPRPSPHIWLWGITLAACVLAAGVFLDPPAWIYSPHAFAAIGLGGLLLTFFVLVMAQTRVSQPSRVTQIVGLASIFLLIVSEAAFVRVNPIKDAYAGEFSQAVYGELSMWVVVALLLGVVTLVNPRYLQGALRPPHIWVTLFALLALVSCAYSTRPLFSVAWAFKLFLIVLALKAISAGITSLADVVGVLRSLWLAFLVVTIAPFAQAFLDPGMLFRGGRLGGLFAATGVSAAAGTLLLLSVLLPASERGKRPVYTATAMLACVILFLGGGKVAIAAALLSTTVFLLLQRKFVHAVGFVTLAGLLGLAAFSFFPPLVEYRQRYVGLGLAETLTGRTVLWPAAFDAIKERPLLGYGFVTSKFASLEVEGIPWPAGHMHNAFLEVLYNNGAIGLVLVVLMNVAILRRLLGVKRNPLPTDGRLVRWGLLAIYLNLLVNGMLTPSFGGRPHSGFLVFLAVLTLAARLQELSKIGLREAGSQIPASYTRPSDGQAFGRTQSLPATWW